MNATVNVGVFVIVFVRNSINHTAWLLHRSGIVEINEGLSIDLTREDREVVANMGYVEHRALEGLCLFGIRKVAIKSGNLAYLPQFYNCKSNSYNAKAMITINKVIEIFCSKDEFCKNLEVELRKKTSFTLQQEFLLIDSRGCSHHQVYYSRSALTICSIWSSTSSDAPLQ